jgi:protein associated with RNAse G/E
MKIMKIIISLVLSASKREWWYQNEMALAIVISRPWLSVGCVVREEGKGVRISKGLEVV